MKQFCVFGWFLVVFLAICAQIGLAEAKEHNSDTGFFNTSGFDKSIPAPETVIGLPVGLNTRRFMSKHPIATPVRLSEQKDLLLRGLLWPEAKERIAGSAYATVERKGHGQIILFACDPTYRAWLGGAERVLLNAVILGPGMGTSSAVPW